MSEPTTAAPAKEFLDKFIVDLLDDAIDSAVANGDNDRAVDLLMMKLTGSIGHNWTAPQMELMREVAEDAATCLRAEGDHTKVVELLEAVIRLATEKLDAHKARIEEV